MHGKRKTAAARRGLSGGRRTTEKTNMAPIGARPAAPRFVRSTVLCRTAGLVLAAFLAACAPNGAPYAGDIEPNQRRFPSLSDVPDRPEGLPTEEVLAERRRRLEADRDAALGPDADPLPEPPVPEPLPELTETMEDLPVERASPGLVEVARAGVSVQVATVYFPGDSTALDQPMIDVLSQVAREQQAIGGVLRVVGHGGPAASEDLTRRQLSEIGQTLVRMGVPPTLIGTELGPPDETAQTDHGRAVIYLDY